MPLRLRQGNTPSGRWRPGRSGAAALVVVIALAGIPGVIRMDDYLEPTSRLDGAESARVEQMLIERFGSPFARSAVLVVNGLDGADTDAGRARVRSMVQPIEALPFVRRTVSPANAVDTLLIGRHAKGAIVLVGLDPREDATHAMRALRATTATMSVAGVTSFEWTGLPALDADLRQAGRDEARSAELRALPLSILVGLWAFRGVARAAAGLVAGVITVLLGLAAAGWIARGVPMTVLTPSIVTLLGLALGIDYALLMILREQESPDDRQHARRAATQTVIIAGLAVAAGMAPLAFMPASEMRSAGLAGMAAVTAAVVVAVTLGAVLARRLPRPAREHRLSRWHGWATRIVRRPWLALGLGLLPTLPLAFAASTLKPAAHAVDTLPQSTESARALRTLESMGRLEAALGFRLVLDLPQGITVFSAEGWAGLRRLEQALAADPRVAAVRSIHHAAGGVGPTIVPRIFPEPVLRSFTTADGTAALFEIAPAQRMTAAGQRQLVADLRRNAARLSGLPGARASLGGVPAYGIDYADALGARAATAVAAAAGLAFLVLLLMLRSVLLALKAVLLNLLSVAAAIGATVLVFQHGWLAGWVGLDAPLDGLVPSVPLLAFCAVFGIGMDYELFLLQRVREERRRGESDTSAIVRGLAHSADVITRSAAIMTAVFIAFAASDFIVVRVIGFALAVAVVLDATLIRLVLAPALLRLAWRWNWWPGERPVRRRTPEREPASVLARMTP